MSVRRLRAVVLIGVAAWGGRCASSGSDPEVFNDTTPMPPAATEPTGEPETDTTDTGTETRGSCARSEDCQDGVCAVPHRAGQTSPPSPEQAMCVCVLEQGCCLPDRFTSFWCLDDSGCCTGRCEVATGFCVSDDGSEGSDTSTETNTAAAMAVEPESRRP